MIAGPAPSDNFLEAGNHADAVIVGAGAAGLMATIWAGRSFPNRRIVLLDGARKLGAKILIAGGGRCNVTHDQIDTAAYAGASRNAIKKVLRRFDVPQTVAFFESLGVPLKREETGKLFPVSNKAQTVLDALLSAADLPNVTLRYPNRVQSIQRCADEFRISGAWGTLAADRVVLATGGKSVPKTGSDGFGYTLAESLGHSLTPHTFPALVPLTLPPDYFLCALSGLTVPATFDLRSANGKKLASFTDSTLCTHFGLSGPAVLDMSRYYTAARFDDPGAHLTANWLPAVSSDELDAELTQPGQTPLKALGKRLPDRLLRALCHTAGVAHTMPLTRDGRRALVQVITQLALPIMGDRGDNYAEVTAGGVPLSELRLETMESRRCAGLFLCGELCDVDGRIGGYNFQWAWSSGYVAGISLWD